MMYVCFLEAPGPSGGLRFERNHPPLSRGESAPFPMNASLNTSPSFDSDDDNEDDEEEEIEDPLSLSFNSTCKSLPLRYIR